MRDTETGVDRENGEELENMETLKLSAKRRGVKEERRLYRMILHKNKIMIKTTIIITIITTAMITVTGLSVKNNIMIRVVMMN